MKPTYFQTRSTLAFAILAILALAPLTLPAAFVQNPSFESNWSDAWPHYGPIDNWTGGSGVNDRSLDRGGPFDDNGLTPDGNRVAFKQQGGDLSQTVSGLTVGQLYWIQFYYNTRGDVLSGTCDITTRFNGNDLDSVTGIQRVTTPEGNGPITVPFHARSVPFAADADSGSLTFHVNTVGDRTALFDAVTIVARGSNDVIVMNPSFEASGTIPGVGPITNNLAGWSATGTYGIDTASGVFCDNGTVPDQDLVAFIQGPGSLTQVINNLVPGTQYQLSFSYNAGSTSHPHVQAASQAGVIFESDVTAVGGSAAFHTATATFTANTNTLVLTFTQTKAGTDTLLLDDIRLLGKTATTLPPLSVSPADAELAPGQSTIVTVTVPSEKLAQGAADIVLSSSDTNIVSFTGADTNGKITLHFAKGGATGQTVTIVAGHRGTASVNVTDSAGLDVPNGILVHVIQSFVRNPSFEAQAAPSGIGMGPILAWEGTGSYGLNQINQPFAANSGPIPDRLQVALIQGMGSLSQQITGLTPGGNYWLQFCYSLRDITDPAGPAIDLAVTLGTQTLVTIPHVMPLSQSGAAFYYFTNVNFVATNTGGALTFTTSNPKGDATVLLDAINITARDPQELVLQNPSFEASGAMDLYIEGPNTAPLFGWTITGGGRGTAAGGPFADNGTVSDQDEVLFLQGANTASQLVSGFTIGQKYSVIYSVNGRGCCGADLTTHYIVLAGSPGAEVTLFEEDLTPVGGSTLYLRRVATFTADATTQNIQFQHVPSGDKTLLLDNIRVVPGEVGSSPALTISVAATGKVQLSWPAPSAGYLLQSAATPVGPWSYNPMPTNSQGGRLTVVLQPTSTAQFYRLSL